MQFQKVHDYVPQKQVTEINNCQRKFQQREFHVFFDVASSARRYCWAIINNCLSHSKHNNYYTVPFFNRMRRSNQNAHVLIHLAKTVQRSV